MVGKRCRRFAFHMKDGSPTMEGLLLARRRREYVVTNVLILQSESESHALAGTVEVPRENVYALQEIT